ncbi:zeta-crystallin isoform X1 [Petromyzon marinus]|uniref:Quinone oxidoreductase isoform X1 n=2 Tax=Petromyzon marinus TaxID=7757 RepID=A0AAJ7UEY9_PETMA|nr:quinone oxidoreductase isoform X1 [Petromyzon marinus]
MQQAVRVMRAIRMREFGPSSVLRLQTDVPVPSPNDKEVLIRVRACGVNPVDTYIRTGTHTRRPELPWTPGGDVAGTVESVGRSISSFKAGDRVYTALAEGGYAEFVCVAHDRVFTLPAQLDFPQGAALGVPYFTAYRALVQKAATRPGETVLIHGASGGVGIALCQMARALGTRVIGTAGSPEGLELVAKHGAHSTFNHREDGYVGRIQELCPRGVDVVFEMLANVNLPSDLKLLGQNGRVVIIGCRGAVEMNPRETLLRELHVMGVSLFNCNAEERQESAAALRAGVESGWLRPAVGSRIPLEEAARAHDEIISSSPTLGKMVLTM